MEEEVENPAQCENWQSAGCLAKCTNLKQEQEIDLLCLHLHEIWFRVSPAMRVRLAHEIATAIGLLRDVPAYYNEQNELIPARTYSLLVTKPR